VTAPATPTEVDPFDLPEWLGEAEVTWSADAGLHAGHRVPGHLTGTSGEDEVACDLLAVDEAYPEPVTDTTLRSRAHQSWQHGQILLASYDGRLTLLVPGTGFDADRVLDALARLAKAVGATPANYAAHLRLGQ